MADFLTSYTYSRYHTSRAQMGAPQTFTRAGVYLCRVGGVARRRVLWRHPVTGALYYHPRGAGWVLPVTVTD